MLLRLVEVLRSVQFRGILKVKSEGVMELILVTHWEELVSGVPLESIWE